jgi:hypothetical protein
MTTYMKDFPGPFPAPICEQAKNDLVDLDARVGDLEDAVGTAEDDIDGAEAALAALAGDTCMFAEPDLAIGTTKTNVAHGSVPLLIAGKFYTLPDSAAGVALPTGTIAQNKYGAFAVDVGANLTVDIAEAADNETGYASAALALAAAKAVTLAAGHKRLGYIVIHTAAAEAFTNGTTELDDSDLQTATAFYDETPVAALATQKAAFYNGVMTRAGLAIGNAAADDIDHGAFDYVINGQKYSKAATDATEVAPDGLSATDGAGAYNGWIFTIGANGTVDLGEDTGEAGAGYATAALALAAAKALVPEAAHVVIGWAAVGNEVGVVTPGTTELTGNVVFENAPTMFEVASGNATMP